MLKIFFQMCIIVLVVFTSTAPLAYAQAQSVAQRVAGRILLQVEDNGEAWYVHPVTFLRYYLNRPTDAFAIMREQGIGITNQNLQRIPAASAVSADVDTDGDGLSDTMGELPVDMQFTRAQRGKIFLQVEGNGEAWYVNPTDDRRYFLGRPADAFAIMQQLGLGITNKDLAHITPIGLAYSAEDLEKKIHTNINEQRALQGLGVLTWNNEIAAVAREHSQNLARENAVFASAGYVCSYPIIHHEGLDFGLYHDDRLNNRGITYQQKSAENIILITNPSYHYTYNASQDIEGEMQQCKEERDQWDKKFTETVGVLDTPAKKLENVRDEIAKRTQAFEEHRSLNIFNRSGVVDVWEINTTVKTESEVAVEMVERWMSSPKHRRNILSTDYNETGIGIANINGYTIATQNFIEH